LVEVLVVVGLVLLVLISVPICLSVKRAWAKMVRLDCVFELKEVGVAARMWAGDHSNSFPMMTSTNQGGTKEVANDVWRDYLAMSNELATPRLLHCPADKRWWVTNFAALRNDNISYFIGLDADQTTPQALLAGDRNLTTNGVAVGPGLLTLTSNSVVGFTKEMHVGAGNLLMSDGSVWQVNSQWLQSQLSSGGMPTNRGAIFRLPGVPTNRLVIP
jgi:hypothetical protein